MKDDSDYVPNTTETETDTDLELLEEDLEVIQEILSPAEFVKKQRSMSSEFIVDSDTDTDEERETENVKKPRSKSRDFIVDSDTDTDEENEREITTIEFTEDDFSYIFEDMYEEFDDYYRTNILKISSPKYHKNMIDDITEIYFTEWFDFGICDEDDYDDVEDFVEQVFESYIIFSGIPKRSILQDITETPISISQEKKETICEIIKTLSDTPQPAQRTKEWYEFRNNLISASNLWKVFGTEAQVNSIIYEKCSSNENTTTPFSAKDSFGSMQWGVKYEKITVMIYESIYKTKLGEFGCIQHSKYPFIGASPDGINVDEASDLYGRMVEIKNIYNREITGIPKQEYWIQTQIQMETCNLDECDFVETRIKEYVDETAFYTDEEHIYKGVVLSFTDNISSQSVYRYMPLNTIIDKETVDEWIETTRDVSKSNGLFIFSISYWYLDCFSCVLIERNRVWFESALSIIKKTWDIIEKERKTGYQHRVPQRKTTNKVIVTHDLSTSYLIKHMPIGNNICLVKLE